MIKPNYKAVVEDSARNRFMFYYAGNSLHCTEVSKDGVSRETTIANKVTDQFLAAVDLQDNIYAVSINNEKGICIFTYYKNEWKLDQILNIQGSGSIYLLSLFIYNNAIHIIYAKQMTIANFYNLHHLYKSTSTNPNNATNPWRKNNICELYAEDLVSSYSSTMSRDGTIHMINEWYDGNNYVINYCSYDNSSSMWKKKPITTLFKKDIKVNILYEDGYIHLLCYTYEDETSAIFYYFKRENTLRDFEFSCLEKIKTEEAVFPYFHIENGTIYASWASDNKYSQYSLNREQKSWSKKVDITIPSMELLQLIEYQRNRKGKAILIKKTYFTVDNKYNLNMPYFKDMTVENSFLSESKQSSEDASTYIPYLLNEIKSLSSMVKTLNDKLEQMDSMSQPQGFVPSFKHREPEQQEVKIRTEEAKTRKSTFRDQFMNSNKLLSRPEAAALFVGSSALPNPEQLSKKESIEIAVNEKPSTEESPQVEAAEIPTPEAAQPAVDNDTGLQKDANLFKKLGDFFK